MTEISRRRFLEGLSGAVPVAAMATLLPDGSAAAKSESRAGNVHIQLPHFAPRAKRAIQLFMSGAPSQMDLWDYKPGLVQMYDQDLPDSVRGNQALTSMTAGQTRFPIAPPYWKFAQYGQSGRHVSDLLPWTAKVVDELALVHTLNTDAINHEPAQLLMNTGNMVPGKASLGAWLSYGLGRMNENLPAFVVLNSKLLPHTNNQPISPKFWTSGFLSSEHAGVAFRSAGTPVLNLRDPAGIPRKSRRAFLDGVNAINRETYERWRDPETLARINQYELAFRMQRSVPELTDLSQGTRQHVETLRRGSEAERHLCQQLPAGAPDGGTRRPLYPDLPAWLGRSWGCRQGTAHSLRGDGSGVLRPDRRSAQTRIAGRHAGHLERGVRAYRL